MPRTPGMVVTLKPTNNTYGGNPQTHQQHHTKPITSGQVVTINPPNITGS